MSPWWLLVIIPVGGSVIVLGMFAVMTLICNKSREVAWVEKWRLTSQAGYQEDRGMIIGKWKKPPEGEEYGRGRAR